MGNSGGDGGEGQAEDRPLGYLWGRGRASERLPGCPPHEPHCPDLPGAGGDPGWGCRLPGGRGPSRQQQGPCQRSPPGALRPNGIRQPPFPSVVCRTQHTQAEGPALGGWGHPSRKPHEASEWGALSPLTGFLPVPGNPRKP